MIVVNNLTVSYNRHLVLYDVSFSAPRGSCIGIVGPNGGGKTTLMKSMLGLLKNISGEIVYFDNQKPLLSYVPQKKKIDWNFPITVFEVVLMGISGKLKFWQNIGKKDRDKVWEILEYLGMEKYAHSHIGRLSGGQQQRMFVARALVQDADIMFLDEPFSGIDNVTEALLIKSFKDLLKRGKTIFVVHHNLNTVAQYFNWLIMLNSHLIAFGPVDKVYTKENFKKLFGSAQFFEETLNKSMFHQKGI